jgi:multidrug resistance efflux pump
VARADAELRYTEAQTTNQIRQAEATLAATEAQVLQARADLENARLSFERMKDLYERHVEAVQAFDQARTTYDAAQARVASLEKQVAAAQAAVGVARANVDQVDASRAALQMNLDQAAAAAAQKQRANVRLGYTEIRAPIGGRIDLRAALSGEVVNPGQAIVTILNPDDLWVRADIEETYIDRIRIGDQLQVRLPSGQQRSGTVFYRAVDADYATQRDVSRSKRDIKTFEIRLRCPNADGALAVGMTAYVTLPVGKK